MRMSPPDSSSLHDGSLGAAWKGFSYINEEKTEVSMIEQTIKLALITDEDF